MMKKDSSAILTFVKLAALLIVPNEDDYGAGDGSDRRLYSLQEAL
ncbi:hypothetical protein [Paenibacillus xylaniclasticus]|nr:MULTISPECIES: hypothetical protein [Paenibacillus]GFN34115.1 hypothetical protein PCURB6_43750 [Paenibacillus curdlanolyticus]